MAVVRCGLLLVVLAACVSAWPFSNNGGRRGGGGSSESREDWWWHGNLPRPADTGLTEECPEILERVAAGLTEIAEQMPTHYGLLIPAIELPFTSNILAYPMEADANLFTAIGEFVLAADSVDDLSERGGGCTKRALMVAVKKLNAALSDGLQGVRQLEEALATLSVPAETSDRLDEWIAAYQAALFLRNDLLECFATADPDSEGEGGEDGEGTGGEDGEGTGGEDGDGTGGEDGEGTGGENGEGTGGEDGEGDTGGEQGGAGEQLP